jgi:hypothetical protein
VFLGLLIGAGLVYGKTILSNVEKKWNSVWCVYFNKYK